VDDAKRVTTRARDLYGDALGAMRGVLHVMAVQARPGGGHRVIRVGARSPKSDTDLFVLNLARARVEGIVISGSILRAEPDLRYNLQTEMTAWRRDVLGLEAPPWLLVLTRGANLPAAHPVFENRAFESEARPIVLTSVDAAPALRRALPSRVEVVGIDAPSPRAAIAHLRGDRGCRGVSIEAGPRVAMPLYAPPSIIDELMLSVYGGPLDPDVEGPPFLSAPELEARLVRVGGPTEVDEPSGRWTFSRWLRAPQP
jgi:riboflavin biosynthesis pyrimidine reductase